MIERSALRVAIVHDWLNQIGGAEYVLEVLHRMFPEAPIFTSLYDPVKMPGHYRQWDIRTSFLQKLPMMGSLSRAVLPLYPLAFEKLDLSGFDLVISNSSGLCHGVITSHDTCHVNYCLTPPRFVWNASHYIHRERVNPLARTVLPLVINYLRMWDIAAVNQVDHFIGISKAVVARIKKIYRREAALIYPPVDTKRFAIADEIGDYFLVVGRMVPYRRVDIVVKACSELGLPLLVVGSGRDKASLEAMAGKTVKFAGRVDDAAIPDLFARCRAFIFPGEEDFGIAPIEAMAAGRPVIAFAAGGSLETVVDGVTGTFFHQQSPEALAAVLSRFDHRQFDPPVIREHALSYDTDAFVESFHGFLAEKLS
ncbi:MAG: glycosyltransferase [Dehalococcoidia bacterium]|nr:glycosyltransferase [Dehalococcoidia bacterium]